MLTAIEVENFRAVRQRARVELAPITLLFGANGVGKSTFLRAVHFGAIQLGVTGAEAFEAEIGSFEECVARGSGRDSIELAFEASLHHPTRDVALEQLLQKVIDDIGGGHWVDDFFAMLESVRVEMLVHRRSYQMFGIDLASKHLETTGSCAGREFVRTVYDWASDEGYDRNLLQIRPNELDGLMTELDLPEPIRASVQRWIQEAGLSGGEWVTIGRISGALFDVQTGIVSDMTMPDLLRAILVLPFGAVRDALDQFIHVGPLRVRPPREERALELDGHHRSNSRWLNGQAAWDALHRAAGPGGNHLADRVNEWLGSDDHLGLGLEVDVLTAREVPLGVFEALAEASDVNALRELVAQLSHQPLVSRFRVRDLRRGVSVAARDHGTGISQLIPVLVAAIAPGFDGVVAVEQPELHVHPAVQADIADVFIANKCGTFRRFLVETHSEHFLLRLMRRIRETTHQKLPRPELALKPDELAIYYIEERDGGVSLSRLPVDEEGDFMAGWPAGFFGERARELF